MLDKNSPIPLYHQLSEILRNMIEQDYHSGDFIPPEPELEKGFNVSRITVRKAIDELVQEGILEKKQGKGTIVQRPKITHDLGRITSWTEEMIKRGQPLETLSVDISEMNPTKRMIQKLQLDPTEKMIHVRRLRATQGEPLSIMNNYLRAQYVPQLLEKGLLYESLYEMLEKEYHLSLVRAEESVEAREASESEAQDLLIRPYAPVLYVTRVTYLPEDIPLEFMNMTTRADRYQYKVSLYGRSIQKK